MKKNTYISKHQFFWLYFMSTFLILFTTFHSWAAITTELQPELQAVHQQKLQVKQVPHIIVLVPGFFNSFTPEYFSQDIINSLSTKQSQVYVMKHLNPIGNIQDNGEKVYASLNALSKMHPQAQIHVIGHSAGGLYTLYAINKGFNRISKLITVSTPFNGVEFVENWAQTSPFLGELLNWCYLDGVKHLTRPLVAKFLKDIKIPNSVKIVSFGGYQKVSVDFFNAYNMSAILAITDKFMSSPSDGIVTFKSATYPVVLKTPENSTRTILVQNKVSIPLEHWEQVLDFKNFVLLGSRNISDIQKEQIKFYSQLRQMLLQ